jgi:Holliday junction resolvase RusA-like endonuclease
MNTSDLSTEPYFEVDVYNCEPPVIHPGRKGKNIQKKLVLQKAIVDASKPEALTEAVTAGKDTVVSVEVHFRLLEATGKMSNTRSVKDLDNLLKGILDVLKNRSQGIGLGIIEGDHYVCELLATKTLVDTKEKEGFRVTVSKFADQRMLPTLRNYDKSQRKANVGNE